MSSYSEHVPNDVDEGSDALMLSVIIPSFNGLPWIEEQLSSLAKYPYSGEWELILVDNASTDSTLTVLRDFARRLDYVRVLEEARKGKSYALNRGIDVAQGKNLVFLDQDDQVTEGFLDAMTSALGSYEVVGGLRDMTWNGDLAVPMQATEGLIGHRWLPAVSGCALGIRAEVARELRFADDVGCAEDFDFSWRAQLAGYRLGVATDAILRYRLRGTGRSRFLQGVAYGEASVLLFIKFQPFGLERRSSADVWREVKSILYWGRAAVRSRSARLRVAHRLGLLVGSIKGSIRRRVWCP